MRRTARVTQPTLKLRENESTNLTQRAPPTQRKAPQETQAENMPAPLHKPSYSPISTARTVHTSPATAELAAETPPRTSSISWKSVERKVSSSSQRPVDIGTQHFPWNNWNLLRPGITFAILHVLSTYFTLGDALLLLHLEVYELDELEEIYESRRNREKLYEIHANDVEEGKRVLAASVRSGELLRDLWRRLEVFGGVKTSREEIDRGKFDLPKGEEERVIAACARRRGSGMEGVISVE
ncbi:hypothetical protein IFR05_014562 [Cadophora sp. M221]|nr:hypothetical protein IFR05_014562 [Cadophora sp. M221]